MLQVCLGISRYHTVILDLQSVVDMSKINTNAFNLFVKQNEFPMYTEVVFHCHTSSSNHCVSHTCKYYLCVDAT